MVRTGRDLKDSNPPATYIHGGHRQPGWLLVPLRVRSCPGELLEDRLGWARPRTPGRSLKRGDARPPAPQHTLPDGARRTVRLSEKRSGTPPRPPGGGQARAGRGGRDAWRGAARSGERPLPRDGGEGGPPRGQRPCPPAEGAEEGEGEEARRGAAVLHGRHLRREERSRHTPTRPEPTGHRATRTGTGTGRRRRQPGGRSEGAAGGQGEVAPPEGDPRPAAVRGGSSSGV